MTTTTQVKRPSGFVGGAKALMGKLGRIGKALLYPIAMLPLAAIFMRIGAQIPGDTEWANFVQKCFSQVGDAVFGNLPILFAIGVGFGLTKDNRGEAAISAFVGSMLLMALMKSAGADLPTQIWGKTQDFHKMFDNKYDAILSGNVLNGIVAGGIVAYIYNRFNGIELPKVLGFFSGRRLIPVLSLLAILFFTMAYAIIFPWIGYGLNELTRGLGDATGNRFANASIQGFYVFLNRMLIPFGLHHIPNTMFWFVLGSHETADGGEVFGDINIFLKGTAENNHSGTFQSPFFPMMMFGLPALVAAMVYMADNKEQKIRVFAMLGGAALVSFLTGITEPIEFAFMFASPVLYFVHALLGSLFGFITGLFGIQLGFGFSAGLFDYLLSIPKSTEIINLNQTGAGKIFANPGWLFPIGIACAGTYFFVGKWAIKKFNIATPGRGVNQIAGSDEENATPSDVAGMSAKAAAIVKGLGGYENITNFQNCTTRLRYDVVDATKVDQEALKKAGARGSIIVSPTHVHVIIGQEVEIVNDEIIANKK